MGEITEITEAIYQDADLRREFLKFVELRTVHKAIVDRVSEQVGSQNPLFLSYSAITSGIYQGQFELWKVKGLQEGVFYLSQSLSKTIAHRYHVSLLQAHQVVGSVADKYEKEGKG
jgi:hypothetical protein